MTVNELLEALENAHPDDEVVISLGSGAHEITDLVQTPAALVFLCDPFEEERRLRQVDTEEEVMLDVDWETLIEEGLEQEKQHQEQCE